MSLTRNQRSVLDRLSRADALFGQDFADIATVQNGRLEWAVPILNRLSEKGFVEKTGERTWKGSSWRMTDAGREALKAPEEEGSPGATAFTEITGEVVNLPRSEDRGFPVA